MKSFVICITDTFISSNGLCGSIMDDDWDVEMVELDADDWKILFHILCMNSAKLELDKGLTIHGKVLLRNVQRKIGINAVGVDMDRTR